MSRIKMIGSRIPKMDARRVPPPPKVADKLYETPEYKRWREGVVARAGRRCEHVEAGVRCIRSEPMDRMYADHIVEVRDGGAEFDAENGQCLCGPHHGAKTAKARAARRR